MKDRKGVDLLGRDSGEELGGTEEGKTVINIYYVCGGNLFSIKGKKRLYIYPLICLNLARML